MMGRPPIPIKNKIAQGDTRNMGARKFAASIAAAKEATLGRPPVPAGVFTLPQLPPAPKEGASESELAAYRYLKDVTERARARLKTSKKHWDYLADQLENEGMLAKCDEGMLTGMALCYGLMAEAARDGSRLDYARLFHRYMQGGNLMGLSVSARAKLPDGIQATSDSIEELYA